MKRPLEICIVALLGLATPFTGAESAKAKEPLALQVQVSVPPSWDAWLDRDVADAFTDRVREIFRRRGLDGKIERIETHEKANADVPLLTIHLVDWRVNPAGNIDCTFTASVQTPRGIRQFGLYTNTSMRWLTGPGRFGLARSFEEAAEGAIRELCDDVAASDMLPGLRKR